MIVEENEFRLVLPLITTLCGQFSINLQFGLWGADRSETWLSCGPSSGGATIEGIDAYLEWLDLEMPRRGMTVRDILEAGNPDNLNLHLEPLQSRWIPSNDSV